MFVGVVVQLGFVRLGCLLLIAFRSLLVPLRRHSRLADLSTGLASLSYNRYIYG